MLQALSWHGVLSYEYIFFSEHMQMIASEKFLL